MKLQENPVSIFPDGRMDAKNAAAYTGRSVKTLAMDRCKGTGPKFVKHGQVFYYKEDLDEWLKEGLSTSTAQASVTGYLPASVGRSH